MEYYGYNPPFFSGQQNVMSRQSGDRLIKNDVMQLLLTMKGERVMRPDWGTDIKATLFEGMSDDVLANLKADIINQLNTYEPRVDVVVNLDPDEDESLLNILVSGIFSNELNHTFEVELEMPLERNV